MKVLSLIGKLIDYPTEELVAASEEVVQAIANDADLTSDDKHNLIKFFDDRCAMDTAGLAV